MPHARRHYCWETREPNHRTLLSRAIQCIWYTDDQDEAIAFSRLQEAEGMYRPIPQPWNVIERVIYLPRIPT
jgi:hypothetical protein